MTIASFLKLVELRTKIASVIPFIIGSLYTLYAFDNFDIINALLMFASMIIFDMTTTSINNYIDYTTAYKKDGYGYEVHNAITACGLSTTHVRYLIYTMLSLSSLLGILLVLRTNWIILILGILCFTIGILYTFGPLPISRTPFGEIFSGVTMGLILTFITIYIHIFNQGILNVGLANGTLSIIISLNPLISIVFICIPLICCIANIMLANNLCDMEEDIANKRYTLPIYIGKKASLTLWGMLYYLSYSAIIVSVLLKILPVITLLTLVTLPMLQRNISRFKLKQAKRETFILSIKNFISFNSVYILSLLLGVCFKYFINFYR